MRRFVEKRSPMLISVLLHAVLLFALWSQVCVLPREPERMTPILMRVVRAPESPAELAPAAAAAVPAVQRTSPNPSEQPSPEIAAVADGEDEEEQPIPTKPTPVPPTASDQKVATVRLDEAILERLDAEQKQDEAELRLRKSKLLAQIAQIAAEAPGVERPYASAGVDRGVVREIDIARYPKSVQQRFMRRYNIKIEHKYVHRGSSTSYINTVITDRGNYLNRGGTGYFEVMTLSKQLLAHMAVLEEQELRKRDLDPLRSHVREIVFGLRETPRGQVDLVVTRFRAEAVD